MTRINKIPKLRLEDTVKIPESTIELFKEVTSEKRILREIIQESEYNKYSLLPHEVHSKKDNACSGNPLDMCMCDNYTRDYTQK
jgi:hypothetical protein